MPMYNVLVCETAIPEVKAIAMAVIAIDSFKTVFFFKWLFILTPSCVKNI
jgi:hypothetical protein